MLVDWKSDDTDDNDKKEGGNGEWQQQWEKYQISYEVSNNPD